MSVAFMENKIAKQSIFLGIILVVLYSIFLKNVFPLWSGFLVAFYGISKIIYSKIKPWLDSKIIYYGENPNSNGSKLFNYSISFILSIIIGALIFLVLNFFIG